MKFGHLEGEQPTRSLKDLLIMVIHHLLSGMILQVDNQKHLAQQFDTLDGNQKSCEKTSWGW